MPDHAVASRGLLQGRMKGMIAEGEAGDHVCRPSAARRTKQILDAAEVCFQMHGFHSTSVAQLAAVAKMSVGHIYRYFPSKNHIIKAIVERDVCQFTAEFDTLSLDQNEIIPALLAHWRSKAQTLCEPGRAVLWLEILAEAGRNPEAAQIVRTARARLSQSLQAVVAAGSQGRWTAEEITTKVSVLLMLTDAAAFGSACNGAETSRDLFEQMMVCGRCLFELA